ncbi:NUDIX domain-containing protein [Candidatus Uabimicrobium sp. HlEnr_7]|uniref:NUDIX hydrolase n=1 Tax=Candidatus Uabimicrobium helgolandensis TaxID=3095367 RepID=UPI0035562F05
MKLATLCYLKKDNKTLMLHRIKKDKDIHAGKWNGLGGKFDEHETPEECAIREIEEESGLVAKELNLKGMITFPKFKDNEDWYVFVYVVPKFSGTLRECEEGELHWIANESLNDLNLWEGDRIFFPWLEQNSFFSAKFIYENGNYIKHEVSFY